MKLKLLKITQFVFDDLKRRVLTMYNGRNGAVTAVQYGAHGDDSAPPKDSIGIYAFTELMGKEVCIGVMSKNFKAEAGEKRLFCTDADGNFKFNLWLRADGTVLIGDSEVPAEFTNFAVKYKELKMGFDAFKNDFNTFVTAFNSHTHVVSNAVPAAPGSVVTVTPLPTGNPSTATIDQSKNEKVKYNE